MEPLFTKEQLNNMNREDLVKVTLLMQEQKSKNENEIQLLKDKQKECILQPQSVTKCNAKV